MEENTVTMQALVMAHASFTAITLSFWGITCSNMDRCKFNASTTCLLKYINDCEEIRRFRSRTTARFLPCANELRR
ncbi:hypothetical protein OK016_02925 [Vibrio chagasii]|nr:hypothetical protein [Vibrio chagasii]